MSELVIDVESSYLKSNCYSADGFLVSVHTYDGTTSKSFDPRGLPQEEIDGAGLIIGFNFKFDAGWLRRYGYRLDHKRIWDVQLAHYLLHRQLKTFPSLHEVLEHYGFEPKLDVVNEQYWKKGIDTDKVPWDILCEYGEYDCVGTYNCYKKQIEEFQERPALFKNFKLRCQDLLVLQEMEHNGLKYNSAKATERSKELQQRIEEIFKELGSVYPDIPINFNSGDQLSAFLYGGVVKEEKRNVIGFYKTGAKVGEPRFRVETVEHTLPRIVGPLPRSELKKPGVFSTDEGTLKKLKGSKRAKELIGRILELAKLDKLRGTYYEGLNKLNMEMNWPKDELHPQYNQCAVKTGRLSSSRPNSQNLSGDVLELLESRYHD